MLEQKEYKESVDTLEETKAIRIKMLSSFKIVRLFTTYKSHQRDLSRCKESVLNNIVRRMLFIILMEFKK